ncbi:MAG: acyltransferase [Blautia sp.]|nr:acyltransferase [Blautia sp.]
MRTDIRNKDYAISVTRLAALSLVIGCHVFEYLGTCYPRYSSLLTPIGNYSSVGVQIFLLISGYLYGKKKIRPGIPFILSNFWKILKDYYVHYLIFTIPLCLVFQAEQINAKSLWGMVTCWCTFGGEVQLWFIPYILFCYLITPMLYEIREWLVAGKNSAIKFCGLIIIIELLFIEYDSYFIPAWICCYVIGYCFPFLVERYRSFLKPWMGGAMLILCLACNVIKYYYRYIRGYMPNTINALIWEGNFKARILNEFFNWSSVLLGIVIALAIYYTTKRILKYRTEKRTQIKWLDIADKYSYDIYICHMLYVKGMLSTIMITPYIVVNLGVTVLLIAINGCLLYYICRPRELFGKIQRSK